MSQDLSTEARQQVIFNCPAFNYSYSPEGTEADRRWVFDDRTLHSFPEAYIYATEITAAAAKAPASEPDDAKPAQDLDGSPVAYNLIHSNTGQEFPVSGDATTTIQNRK